MTDLAVHSENWDLAIVDGDLVIVDGAASVAQSTSITLKLNQGEWFLDQRQGLERDRVFGKSISTVLRDAEYRRAILSVDGVIEVLDLQVEFDPVTRTATPKFKARTVFDGVDPIEIGGDYDPLAFPPIEGCPLPEDGIYSGGVWQGPEPAAAGLYGWMEGHRPLSSVPEMQIITRFGITESQAREMFSVVGGKLRIDSQPAWSAGADLYCGFRVYFPALGVFNNQQLDFAPRMEMLSMTSQQGGARIFMGVETIDENGDLYLIDNATSSEAGSGYWFKTSQSPTLIGRCFGSEDESGGSTPNKSYTNFYMSHLRFGGFSQFDIYKAGGGALNQSANVEMFKYNRSNSYTWVSIQDPRKKLIEDQTYYLRPFIDIDVRSFSSTSEYIHDVVDFAFFGTPKA